MVLKPMRVTVEQTTLCMYVYNIVAGYYIRTSKSVVTAITSSVRLPNVSICIETV